MTAAVRPSPLLSALIAVLAAFAALGITIWAMTMPWFTSLATPAQVDSARAGLPVERMVELAEEVRRFVTDADAPMLPETVDGRPGFDADAVSHLVDVRNVMLAARWATLALVALLLVATLWAASADRGSDVTAGLKWGGLGVIGAVGLMMLIGVLDFDGFFSGFHQLFFQPGTWQFPADSLLILVFPLGFWMLAAAITGVVLTTLGAALVLLGRSTLARA